MDKDKEAQNSPEEVSQDPVSPPPGILSTALTPQEYLEIRMLSEELGVSISHLGRAIVRLGLIHIKGVAEEAKEGLCLRLIKLGK